VATADQREESSEHLGRASRWHLIATVVWAVAVLPLTFVPWMRSSVFLVLLLSEYANVIGHMGGYEAAKAKEATDGGHLASRVHLCAAVFWFLTVIPIALSPKLRTSVYLVLLISLYAIVVQHWTAYESSRAKEVVTDATDA
jgi:hypothetical protein